MPEEDRTQIEPPVEPNSPEVIQLPEFGEFIVIEAINAEECIDPRKSLEFIEPEGELAALISYNPNIVRSHHYDGSERSPAGSFGKAMSLLGAVPDLLPQRAVDIVKEWDESEGRTFTLHEDDNAHGHGLGCKHVDIASQQENEELYGLPSDKVVAMRDYIVSKAKQKEMTVDVPMLTHSHREKGVLIVLSDNKTVMATNGKDEFFRFDATRHDKSLDRLAYFAQGRGIPVNADILKATAERQRNATLMLVAPNLPIYEIDLRGQTITITPKGTVSPKPQP